MREGAGGGANGAAGGGVPGIAGEGIHGPDIGLVQAKAGAAALFRGQGSGDTALIRLAEFRGLGVVEGSGAGPVTGGGVELVQEARSIGGVRRRVECLLQRGEGVRVMVQVDLHAADVDRADPLGLKGANGSQGRVLGGEVMAGALGVDGPGPGGDVAAAIGAAAFDAGDGGHEHGRNRAGAFGGEDGVAALVARREPGRLRCAGAWGQGEGEDSGEGCNCF